jgi:hypothetical protein
LASMRKTLASEGLIGPDRRARPLGRDGAGRLEPQDVLIADEVKALVATSADRAMTSPDLTVAFGRETVPDVR